jgi:hypothetical protein
VQVLWSLDEHLASLRCTGLILYHNAAEIAQELKPHIKAVVVVSAHWESVSSVRFKVLLVGCTAACCSAWPESIYPQRQHIHLFIGMAGWGSNRDILGGTEGPAVRLLQLSTGELQVQVSIAWQPTAG